MKEYFRKSLKSALTTLKFLGFALIAVVGIIMLIGLIELLWDAVPANRAEIRIFNDTTKPVTLQNLPCDDFCAQYEVVALLRPGDAFKRVMVPFSNLAPYRVYDANNKLIGCVDLRHYYNLLPQHTEVGVSEVASCYVAN